MIAQSSRVRSMGFYFIEQNKQDNEASHMYDGYFTANNWYLYLIVGTGAKIYPVHVTEYKGD
jgi:hypothetical protein